MKLKFEDLKGIEKTMEIKSVDFGHRTGEALVYDTKGNVYRIDNDRVISVRD